MQAIEKLARSIAINFVEGKTPIRLATIQMEMEKCFNKEYQSVDDEQHERKARIISKAQVLLGADRKHMTVQEMNSTYNQACH